LLGWGTRDSGGSGEGREESDAAIGSFAGRRPKRRGSPMSNATLTFDSAANLIASVGCPSFSHSLMRTSKEVIEADYCTLFAFQDGHRPACLVATGVQSPSAAMQASQRYLHDHWRTDPTLKHRPMGEDRTVHHVFSSEFSNERYRRDCFDIPQISDRLTLIFKENQVLLRMSFYRYRRRYVFGLTETDRLRNAWKLFQEAARRHFLLSRELGVDPATGRPSIEVMSERLLNTKKGLSEREIEVCSRILLGLTAEGISHDLGIGLTSVVTYRKRAYAKLGISSQNELFSRCLVS
jgi:DNA-binding CsgD family transcriptional regulator